MLIRILLSFLNRSMNIIRNHSYTGEVHWFLTIRNFDSYFLSTFQFFSCFLLQIHLAHYFFKRRADIRSDIKR